MPFKSRRRFAGKGKRRRFGGARRYSRRRSTAMVNYAARVATAFGLPRVRMFTTAGVVSLTTGLFRLPAPLVNIGACSYQTLWSVVLNAADYDLYLYCTGAPNSVTDAAYGEISGVAAQCMGRTVPSNNFSLTYPAGAASNTVLFNPKLCKFFTHKYFWCGGCKWQWTPPRENKISVTRINLGGRVQHECKHEIIAFGTEAASYYREPPNTAILGRASIDYKDSISNPVTRNFTAETAPVSGFIRNASPVARMPANLQEGMTIANAANPGSPITATNRDPNGIANFLITTSFYNTDADGNLERIWRMHYGDLMIKKYWFYDPYGTVVANPSLGNDNPRLEPLEKMRPIDPRDMTIEEFRMCEEMDRTVLSQTQTMNPARMIPK